MCKNSNFFIFFVQATGAPSLPLQWGLQGGLKKKTKSGNELSWKGERSRGMWWEPRAALGLLQVAGRMLTGCHPAAGW